MSRRLYSLLLRLYPRSFRERFSRSMVNAFEERHREISTGGLLRITWFWCCTVWDVVRIASIEHSGMARRRFRGQYNGRTGLAAGVQRRMRDLRSAFRSMVKYPASTIVAIATFAFGIGFVATAFSIVYGSTIRGLPFERADELVHFERRNVEENLLHMAVTPHDYVDWKDQQQTFEDLAAFVEAYVLIQDDVNAPQPEVGVRIDAEAFDLLRVQPAIGRVFTREENQAGGPDVILLSHALWETRFGGDTSIVGQVIRITETSAAPHTVIGVMPQGFGFPIAERFWLPLQLDLGAFERGTGRLDVFGRLRNRTSFEEAGSEFELISQRLADEYPETNRGVQASLSTFQDEYVGPEFAKRVNLMLAGSVLVLLIACLNVANLLVVRSIQRSRELAIRTALGASRKSVAILVLTEATLISVIGGVLAVALAAFGVQWFGNALLAAGALRLPHGGDALFWWQFKLDLVPLGFAFLMTAACALAAGLVPAIHAGRADIVTLLKDEGRNSPSARIRKFGHVLVTLEVALAAALLTATALTVKSLTRIQSLDVGFPPEQIMTARIGLYGEGYDSDAARRRSFWAQIIEGAGNLPGVTETSLSTGVPMVPHRSSRFTIPGSQVEERGDALVARFATVSAEYFDTFGLRLTSGRLFTASDLASDAPVMVINNSFAARFFPGEDPLGRTIAIQRGGRAERVIVGVVTDSWMDGERNRDRHGFFVPLAGATPLDLTLAIRSVGALPTVEQLQSLVADLDPEQPIYAVQTMQALIETRTGRFAVYGTLYILLGVTALLLSLIGLYGVISFNVGTRSGEIGIRMALGANDTSVVSSVLRLGLTHILAGLAIGAGLAYWIAQGLESVLFQVETWEPGAFALVAVVLAVTGLGASALPAWRAARVSPARALRE